MENKMNTHLFGDILYWTSVDPKKLVVPGFFLRLCAQKKSLLYLGMLSLSYVNRDHKLRRNPSLPRPLASRRT